MFDKSIVAHRPVAWQRPRNKRDIRFISEQRLGKHVPAETRRTRQYSYNGDGSVFYEVRTAIVAMQRHNKHFSTTIEELCFVCGPCGGVILNTIGATVQLNVSL
jgi:hypothetical protein